MARGGWFYLSTVLDDFSRYIVAWKLCTTMAASDVTDTLNLALQASGLEQVAVVHRPRLLSDNGPCYVSSELAQENYYLPGDLEAEIATFVNHYNTRRYHESLNNLVPADVYTGRGDAIRMERERIKRQTLLHRRLQHIQHAA